jgi:hypothetical protein
VISSDGEPRSDPHGVFRSSAGPHDVFVGRAPGRMDVMGGIADYSGSLVLQMPLAEACMVCSVRTCKRIYICTRMYMDVYNIGPPSSSPC